MTERSVGDRPRMVGVNHVALEVGDIDAALAFYGAIFDFELRGRSETMAFIDMGDQFLALQLGRKQPGDDGRHFGVVVDDRSKVEELVEAAGGTLLPGRFLDFLDPWGNRIEVVEYRNIQFTKSPAIMAKLGVDATKTESAIEELRAKGMAD